MGKTNVPVILSVIVVIFAVMSVSILGYANFVAPIQEKLFTIDNRLNLIEYRLNQQAVINRI